MGLLSKRLHVLIGIFTILFITASNVSACIIINEVYPRPAVAKNEWIEIYNNCSATANLSLLSVADDDSHAYMLNGMLSSNDFCVVANNASMFNESFSTTGPLVDLEGVNYWLNNDGDIVTLLNDSYVIDLMEYGDIGKEISVSRCGGGWEVMENATPGYANTCPSPSAEHGELFLENFTASRHAAANGDPINFSFSVRNGLNGSVSFAAYVEVINAGGCGCGDFEVAQGGCVNVTCNWTVPEDMQTDGEEDFEARAYITFNGSEIEGDRLVIKIEGLPDLGNINLTVNGPEVPVRFGDFSRVNARIYTGNVRVPMRIVTYVYKPRWITTDLDGSTIRTDLNETKVSLLVEETGRGQVILLQLPIFLRENCEGEYEEGVYRGNVRIYEDKTSRVITERNFNITMEGNNDIFCSECPECENIECDCGSGSLGYYTTGSSPGTGSYEARASRFMEIESFEGSVTSGGIMETVVKVKNALSSRQDFSVYSYAFNGSRCVSLGREGSAWKRTWDANKKVVNLGAGESVNVTLENMIWEDAEPGTYKFRVRLRHGESKDDLTMEINVTEAYEPEAEGDHANQSEEGLKAEEKITAQEVLNETGEEPPDYAPTATGMAVSQDVGLLTLIYNLYISLSEFLLSIFKF